MAVIVEPRNLTSGAGELWSAEVGASEPSDDEINLDVDLTAVANEWEGLGGTNDGITLNVSIEYFELEVDQELDTVERRATKRDVSVATNLAELTLENLRRTQNGGTTTTGNGVKSYEPATGRELAQPHYSALLLDGWGPAHQRRRCVIRRTLNVAETSTSYSKDGMSLYPVEVHGHFVATNIKPYRVSEGIPAAPTP
ncbi:hypothetical protein BJF83_20860 [Nocardiopsis sp. CNR-923]|nr:hypothetical protein BJF83_20860 [Nocardiopsis sp. CNR-923]